MIIIPAIDLLGGQCVRLYKGEYDSASRVADDPISTAERFEQAGTEWIHVVDLDGAKSGKTENIDTIMSICSHTKTKIEVGGGIRTLETIDRYISCGVSRVILGSAAVQKPELIREAVQKYSERIAVGIDALDGYVNVSGWTEKTNEYYIDFAKRMESEGVQNIIFTDISRDGTLSGPALEMYAELGKHVKLDITASGGVRDEGDIINLKALGLYAAICGKSIYSGTLSLKRALEICGK